MDVSREQHKELNRKEILEHSMIDILKISVDAEVDIGTFLSIMKEVAERNNLDWNFINENI